LLIVKYSVLCTGARCQFLSARLKFVIKIRKFYQMLKIRLSSFFAHCSLLQFSKICELKN